MNGPGTGNGGVRRHRTIRSWKARASRSIAALEYAGCRTCRSLRGCAWAGRARLSNSTAPRGSGDATSSRSRRLRRSIPSATSMRRSSSSSRDGARRRSGKKTAAGVRSWSGSPDPPRRDRRRSPGFRRLEPHLAGNVFYHWIGQHETGRYSKAHAHESAAVLICIAGKGYTYAWSRDIGTRPWETGQAEKVLRQDYEPVGMVSAAPMGGQHFHQHFGVGREPLRLMAWFGPFGRGTGREPGRPGEEVLDKNAMHLEEGGNAIPYWDEDPYIRQEYEAAIRREGVEFRMDNAFYQRPSSRAAPARSGPPQT